MTSRSRVTQIVQDKIQASADEKKADAEGYATHVFEGGDPTEIGTFLRKWDGAKRYADEIANAYRETQGQWAIPYSPVSRTSWLLCDRLLAKLGQWISYSELRDVTGGQQVPPFLKSYALRDAGYALEKDVIDGKVHYRLVKAGVE